MVDSPVGGKEFGCGDEKEEVPRPADSPLRTHGEWDSSTQHHSIQWGIHRIFAYGMAYILHGHQSVVRARGPTLVGN